MLITIAICTYNRAESLHRTLQSLVAMRVPVDVDWEVMIVNNNSADDTDEVIATFADRLPLRREFEARPGKSNACNRAIDAARGEYFLWTDDDVVVDPGWLAAYAEAFRRWPDAAVFGGPVRPRYEEPAIKWVAESEGLLGSGPFAIRDIGQEDVLLLQRDGLLPPGANMAIRGIEQRTFRYNPELGPGTRLRFAEDRDVVLRVLHSGKVGYWVPAAGVEHCIGHERQSIKYLVDYFALCGEYDAFFEQQNGKQQIMLFGVPRWLWRGMIEGWLLYRIHRLIAPGPVWVRHLKTYAYASGAIRYWWSEGRKPATPERSRGHLSGGAASCSGPQPPDLVAR